jgi:hypothetical protein
VDGNMAAVSSLRLLHLTQIDEEDELELVILTIHMMAHIHLLIV